MSRGVYLPKVPTAKAFRPTTPSLGPGAFESFDIRPFWRVASCAEVGCGPYERGWSSTFDESTPLGQRQAAYVRHESGRRFVESKTPLGWTQFDFPAGQTCFGSDQHRLQAERPALYLRQGGDWRRRVGAVRRYDRPDQWADDFHARTTGVSTARSRAGTADP
ncbi:MAG TPA: hypothetical protein VF228_15985 [Iamia sp.]